MDPHLSLKFIFEGVHNFDGLIALAKFLKGHSVVRHRLDVMSALRAETAIVLEASID